MKRRKRLVVAVALLTLLCMPLVSRGTTRGIMGMWVNNYDGEGCQSSDFNRDAFDDFYHDLRDTLEGYSPYDELTQYSESNVYTGKLLESWRHFAPHADPTSWQDGIDRNDYTDRTVLVLSMHGGISHLDSGGTPYWWFRLAHRTDDWNVDDSYTMGDGEDVEDKFQRCHTWWRNRNSWGRELIRMGSSESYSSVGDGDCRWVIIHACHGLQLDDPTGGDHPTYDVQDLWGFSDLNGGYRVILGGSGVWNSDVGTASSLFVTYQMAYPLYYTFKQAWFAAMDDEFDVNSYPNEGKCVIYAKGSSSAAASYTRDNDDFKAYGTDPVPPAGTSSPLYTSYSYMNCEE